MLTTCWNCNWCNWDSIVNIQIKNYWSFLCSKNCISCIHCILQLEIVSVKWWNSKHEVISRYCIMPTTICTQTFYCQYIISGNCDTVWTQVSCLLTFFQASICCTCSWNSCSSTWCTSLAHRWSSAIIISSHYATNTVICVITLALYECQ